jgi:hypothetical protein
MWSCWIHARTGGEQADTRQGPGSSGKLEHQTPIPIQKSLKYQITQGQGSSISRLPATGAVRCMFTDTPDAGRELSKDHKMSNGAGGPPHLL